MNAEAPLSRHGMVTILGLWMFVAILWLLAMGLPHLADAMLCSVVVLLSLPLALLLFRRRSLRRRAILAVYLARGSAWRRRLRGGVLMWLGRAGAALLLSLLLVVGLARAGPSPLWGALAVLVPLWLVTHGWLGSRMLRDLNPRYRRMVTDRMLGAVAGGLLLAGLVIWSLHQPVPRLEGVSMEAAILAYTAEVAAASRLLELGLVATAALAALPHWLVQNVSGEAGGMAPRLVLWALTLLREWLLVWPLLLLLQAMHGLLDGSLTRDQGEEPDDGVEGHVKR